MEKQIAVKKKVFWEVRDATACDAMLKQYQSHISSGRNAGALLLCVVGAKLSEGVSCCMQIQLLEWLVGPHILLQFGISTTSWTRGDELWPH